MIGEDDLPERLMRIKARQFGMEFIDLRNVEIPSSVIALFSESLALLHTAMPFAYQGGVIKVAMADPLDFESIDMLRFVLNCEVEVALAPKSAIIEAIDRYYGISSSEAG